VRGVYSDPESPRLALGWALRDAIYGIGPGINPSRFWAVKLKWQAF
jgi:hypothetical protein